MKIYEGKVNTKYKITDILGEGNARRRLLDMGFTPDCTITLENIAPSGGTYLVGLRGFLVALRTDAASLIEVERAV